MKVSLPDTENFNIDEHELFGEKVFLVTPKLSGTEWTRDNLIFRSSLWTEDWQPVSLGFKKFFNWGEKPGVCPDPVNLERTWAMEKIDGSLLIVSQYKGHVIMRTRGTIDAHQMPNGYELDLLARMNPKVFDNHLLHTEEVSILYEWVSPTNQIILKYEKPELFLVGVVNHADYSYFMQREVDALAEIVGVRRPALHTFSSIEDLLRITADAKQREGICLYYNEGQDIKKVKSLDYLKRHAFKMNCTYKNVLSLWLDAGKTDIDAFEQRVTQEFDYECWLMAKENAEAVLRHYATVADSIRQVEELVTPLRGLVRKEAAAAILAKYQGTSYSGIAFKRLDGKDVGNDDLKKLILAQCEKENFESVKQNMFRREQEDF